MDPEEIRNLSFKDLLEEFLHYLEDKSYNQSTLISYRRTLRKIESFMDVHGIGAYTPEIGVHYYENYLAENQLCISRKKAILTAIRRLNEFIPEWNIRFSVHIKLNYCPIITSMHWTCLLRSVLKSATKISLLTQRSDLLVIS